MTTQDEIASFIRAAFPQSRFEIVEVHAKTATLRRSVGSDDLRPGGTVSGPTLMGLADAALYVAILGTVGMVVQAVTSSLTINFLRKPSAERDVVAVCKLLKVGRTSIVGEVSLFSEGEEEPVAHVVGTYAMPNTTPTAR